MKNFITIVPFLVIFSLSAMASDFRIKFPPMEVFHADRDMSSDTLIVTNAAGRVILSGRTGQFENRPFNLPAGTYKATLNYFDDETLPLEKEFVLEENLGRTLHVRHIFNFGPFQKPMKIASTLHGGRYYIWAESQSLTSTIMLVSAGSVLIKPTAQVFMELTYRSYFHDGESRKCISGLSLDRFAMGEVNIPLLRINNIPTSVRIDKTDRVASVGGLTIQIPTVANYEIFSKNSGDQVTMLTTCLYPDEEHSVRTFNGNVQLILPTGEYVIEAMGSPRTFTITEGKTTGLYF